MAFFYHYTVCDAVITVTGVEVASAEKPIEELLKVSSDDRNRRPETTGKLLYDVQAG